MLQQPGEIGSLSWIRINDVISYTTIVIGISVSLVLPSLSLILTYEVVLGLVALSERQEDGSSIPSHVGEHTCGAND